jgi:hypothetical protein
MAIGKINKSFTPMKRNISYLSKNFSEYRQNLIDYARVYFPNTNTDFNEASPGMMFIEMAAYIGDVLGYYIDTNFRENLLSYANEMGNIIPLAQSMGYKTKPGAAANCDLDVYQLCPAIATGLDYSPDPRYFLRLAPSAIFSATNFPTNFRTIEEANFADPSDREISVYATDVNNKPLTYLIKKRVRTIAGTIKSYTATFGAPTKFAKVSLPDTDVMDIISVVDGAGNTWYEVDFLAQDLVFQDNVNANTVSDTSFSVPPTYTIKVVRTPRRFVTRYNENFNLELHFGSGVIDDNDATINLEPKKLSNSEYLTNLASTSLDPSDFLSSRSYGSAPGNTTLTITYAVGGGIETNVPSNSISKISTVRVLNDTTSFSAAELALHRDVVASIGSNNPEPATGGKGADSIEEIRAGALGFFNAQNRAVTANDYVARVYAMPPKYGAVSKVFVAKDEQLNSILRAAQDQTPPSGVYVEDQPGPGVINLYVLGYNQYKKLTPLNTESKKNLKNYLDQYRMLTDTVRILDAFVVNIGVNFKVVVYKNYNMNEVLARTIDRVNTFFNIDAWQLNQPIILNDLYMEIASTEGVQSVLSVEVFNRYSFKDGSDYEDYIYDIGSATNNGIIYPSLDPCIFEIRYPEQDIIGNAVQ